MNTAEKLEYQDQMDTMTKINHQAFANTVWDDPQKAITIHEFWKTFSHGKSKEIQRIAQLEMRRIEATLQAMTDINVGFYGVKASAYVDTVGVIVESADDASIEEIMPDSEIVVDAETDISAEAKKQEEEGGKTLSLFNGKDMGEKPNQVDVSKAVKQLLADSREEDALALAKQYLGTGNYTPKKPGATPQPWKDPQIESWIKSLKSGLSKSTPIVPTLGPVVTEPEVETKEESTEAVTVENTETFGPTMNTLETERHALNDFAKRYVRLAINGSEDAIAAEELSKLFFKDREYTDKQIQVWKETVTGNDDFETLDQFAVLGAIGTDDGQLIITDLTYEDIMTKVYDMMQEIQVTKPQLDDTTTLKEYMVDQIGRKLYDELKTTYFENESGAAYELYTKLHYTDFIERVVVANFTTLDSQATTSEEAGQETGEDSSSEEAKQESSFEDEQKAAMETAKRKGVIGTNIKEVTLSIIKNGGIIDDVIGNKNYESFIGKEHKFQTREALEKHVTEQFDTWTIEWKNSLTSYPMDEFQRAIDTAYFSEVPYKDAVEKAKEFMVKPDGKLLMLLDKKAKMEVHFPSVQDLEDYILKIYKNNKNAEGQTQAVAEVQSDTQEDVAEAGTKSESTEEETKESSGEATQPVVESTGGLVVKIQHIENICNKAIKKGKDLAFVMKDRKISELVEKGGAIIGPARDTRVDYDISAESFEQLRIDLQKIFDGAVAKRKPTTLEKIKQIVSTTKGEESENVKTEEVTQPSESVENEVSSITSLNDVKDAGMTLIEGGGSKEDLLQWGRDSLLNRQMKEQEDNAVFKTATAVDTFIRGMFSDFFKAGEPEVIEGKKTENDLKEFIVSASTEENASYISVCKAANTYATENAIEVKTGGLLKLVRETATELHQAHLDKNNASREESKDKVFVPEKISETAPTVWDKVKAFKTLGEIYAIDIELCDAGNWQQALNITTELIKGGNIESTENWTDDMITQWFDVHVLKKEVPESTQEAEIIEEVEDLDKNFKALQNANGGKSFRNVLIQILSENEDTPELRKKIETTVRGSRSNYPRKIAKLKSDVIQGKINAAKLLVKKKT